MKDFMITSYDKKISVDDFNPDDTLNLDKKDAKAETLLLKERFRALQEMLYASKKYALLIVLQGMDCSGKDGAVNNALSEINPSGFSVKAFKVPTPEELSHDYLWRIHQQTPGKGEITVFNRSYYEDVLVTRVHGQIDDKTARDRFEEIRNFEKYLRNNHTIILKFFLHISKEFQKEQLLERLEEPEKNWKFSENDLKERELWEQYQLCYSDVLSRCSSSHAPWYVVPSNHRWVRDYFILTAIVKTLEKLDLEYPEIQGNEQKLIDAVKASE
ncbi:MAG: polyphosphate kinase 2 family protein [Clostridiales bacterium]|nr:polyphosphate kinase 2 family protein [Clostridiales bacterium]